VLEAHAAGCEVCRGVAEAANWMQSLAQAPGSSRALADASLVYWRARFSEQEAESDKAQEILDWAELAAGVVAIGFGGWGAWRWATIQGWIGGLIAGLADGATRWTGFYAAPAAALSAGGALGLVALVLVLTYPGVVDE
jgi:hypothetical protein